MHGAEKLKDICYSIEKRLRKLPGLALLKWANKETPLLFLILVWGLAGLVGLGALVLTLTGYLSHDDFNIMLSILALIAAFILSIVVVL